MVHENTQLHAAAALPFVHVQNLNEEMFLPYRHQENLDSGHDVILYHKYYVIV